MTEIMITFEGKMRDLNDFVFDLFEAHMLTAGLEKEAPGDAILVLKPMGMRKSPLSQAAIEVGLLIGQNIALPLFVNWLYDKWKKNGEKHISIKIENRFYQFDPELLVKAIEKMVVKQAGKKASASALTAPASNRPASAGQQGHRKSRS